LGVEQEGQIGSGRFYLVGLRTFWSILDLEFNTLPFGQSAETFPLDLGEMDEYFATRILDYEPVALGIVKPLNFPANTQGELP
jgi:hypothetical protein